MSIKIIHLRSSARNKSQSPLASRLRTCALLFGLLLAPNLTSAAELPPFQRAPSTRTQPQPKLAVLFELKLRLPEGRGLARLLLEAGVDRSDAEAAARIAAGHLGDGLGGCDVKVEISRSTQEASLRLDRAVLVTQAGETVIERRHGELAVTTAQGSARRLSRLI